MRDWLGRYLTSWRLLEDLTIAAAIYIVVVEILHLPWWATLIGAFIAEALCDPVAAFLRRNIKHKETTVMGWSDGNTIFDKQTNAYLALNLNDRALYTLTSTLIDSLQQEDWDTESESFDEFRTHLPIVAAFYNNEVNQYVNEAEEGRLGYDPDRNEWFLICEGEGCDDKVIACAPFTVEGHDQLLNVWSFHDVSVHGGDGKLDWPDMFLTPSPDDGPALLTLQILDGLVVSFPRDWSVKGCDGSDPDRFVIEFNRPAPADHPDIIRATPADHVVAAGTGQDPS